MNLQRRYLDFTGKSMDSLNNRVKGRFKMESSPSRPRIFWTRLARIGKAKRGKMRS